MDVTATLPPELVEILSHHEWTLQETARIFGSARQAELQRNAGLSVLEAVFQDSLKLKNKLDELEQYDPSTSDVDLQSLLATLLNCEYQIYKLNAASPLRQNPFLSHWVEVITGWKERSPAPPPDDSGREHSIRAARWTQILQTRVELVEAILKQEDIERLGQHTPASLLEHFRSSPVRDFRIDPYIQILVEEGIYERPPQAESSDSSSPPLAPPPPPPPGSASAASPAPNPPHPPLASVSTHEDLLNRLSTDPSDALRTITRLPVTLSSLELINALLTFPACAELPIEPAALVREYLQHSLRRLERVDSRLQPPHTAIGEGSGSGSAATEQEEEEAGDVPDREAQIRAVKLLVLFIRNLIRKGLVSPEEIFFEIREICVRYIWIREVREFRAFVEEGGG